jgi:hypothetical protein
MSADRGRDDIKTPQEYDKWYNVTIRKSGDKIIVKGTLDIKDQNPFGTGYIYSFNSAEKYFLSGDDLGNIGDNIIVEIEIDDMILPTVIRVLQESKNQFYSPLLMLIGVIIFITGFYFHIKYKKFKKLTT